MMNKTFRIELIKTISVMMAGIFLGILWAIRFSERPGIEYGTLAIAFITGCIFGYIMRMMDSNDRNLFKDKKII